MKNIIQSTIIAVLLLLATHTTAQTKTEQEIRNLDESEALAVLKGDTTTLFKKLWAPEFIVNNPANIVIPKQVVEELVRTGKISYEAFERIIEKVSVINNTAIVMGREEVKPKPGADNADKKLTRRYTDIWMKRNNNWQLVARQATITVVQ